jgi:hypothetical protein
VGEPGDAADVPDGCPFQFEEVGHWQGEPSSPDPNNPAVETGDKYAVDPSQWYVWWAATSAGGNGSNRLDTIILVGRGWAYDDPLLRYGTVSDVNFVSFMNDYQGGGVEIMTPSDSWLDRDCNGDDTPDLVTVPGSYSPTSRLANADEGEGEPVICSDHKPVGARLRVTFMR